MEKLGLSPENEEKVEEMLNTLQGFDIYNYDCGDSIAITLHGTYAVYRAERVFAFVKWN